MESCRGSVRPVEDADRAWVNQFVSDYWGGPTIISGEHEHREIEMVLDL